jgi:ketopantoate reductase
MLTGGILGMGGVGGYFGGLLACANQINSKLYLLLAVKRKQLQSQD